jgi:chemosensory pili system protein ChpA (sensor histidine kinase/response regulator)
MEPITTVDAANLATSAVTATQKVMIVNGSAEVLELLETVLEAGHYDVVFVESNEHAYSQIRRVQPDLVILCVAMDDADGLQVLSMLKLDERTRGIPILTYATESMSEPTEDDADDAAEADDALFVVKPAVRMN